MGALELDSMFWRLRN